ncbi:MAG: ABC transporter [Gammaproteobacteria bacterium]|nr:MAG: ABC transporter [Gammaproteobacteria bacterium]
MRLTMKTYIKKVCVLLAAMGMLSGCLSPVKTAPESAYFINSMPVYVPTKRTRPVTLLVMPPETVAAFNTTQMAYSVTPHQIAYYAKNRWADTPAQMLLPLMVQTLQNTHYFHAVVTPPFMSRYDYVLNTQILALEQDFTYQPAVVRITLRVQISRVASNQVIATKQLTVVEPILQAPPYGGVVAANRAAQEAMIELAEFCIKKI